MDRVEVYMAWVYRFISWASDVCFQRILVVSVSAGSQLYEFIGIGIVCLCLALVRGQKATEWLKSCLLFAGEGFKLWMVRSSGLVTQDDTVMTKPNNSSNNMVTPYSTLYLITYTMSLPHIKYGVTETIGKKLQEQWKNFGNPNSNLNEEEREYLVKTLAEVPESLDLNHGIKQVIFDCGATSHASGYKEDFRDGTLVKLKDDVFMQGIAGSIPATHKGILHYEFLSDCGEKEIIEDEGYLMPELPCRLFSPQSYLHNLGINMNNPMSVHLTIFHDRAVFTLKTGNKVTIPFDPRSNLPTLNVNMDLESVSTQLTAYQGTVTDETNQNLTGHQKALLKWHYRLGHLGMQHIQWLGRKGVLDGHGDKWGSTSVNPPKCGACLFGKQHRRPTPGVTQKKHPGGILKKGMLNPGDLVFSDQFESRIEGKVFSYKGATLRAESYRGGTIFCDAASSFISIHHQTTFTADETILSKYKFEREAMGVGVDVKRYVTDNGVYSSRDFVREVHGKGQTIKHSGVGGHHHNGVAESAIGSIMMKARTMMLHTGMRWPTCSNKNLWPMAVTYAVHLHNNTPSMETGLAPLEVWARTKSTHSALRNTHPRGCPVYILNPTLQDGQKIPKWQPRSRVGQNMGVSPLHASSVCLVRNLVTGRVSPQFHVVYDDNYETVHSDEDSQPLLWEEMLSTSAFRSDYDPESEVPDLHDEWMDPEELRKRVDERNKEIEQRGSRVDIHEDNIIKPILTRDHIVLDPNGTSTSTIVKEKGRKEPDDIFTPRKSSRRKKSPERLNYDKLGGSYTNGMAMRMAKKLEIDEGFFTLLMAHMTDTEYGAFDNLPVDALTRGMHMMKGFKSGIPDPDTPTMAEAMRGPHREDFLEAMQNEISELEAHKTWTEMNRSALPAGANVLPSTWAYKVKRYPDGRLRKFKSRFVARGDKQIEGVDYGEKYAPVVSWTTVRTMMTLAIHSGWKTRQVDFSNAFVQENLEEEVYLALPPGFTASDGSRKDTVLKLNKSLYGLVQTPRAWNSHLV